MKIIAVQFSRNKAEYPYICTAAEAEHIQIGSRVVVPTTMKDDGTVTLSIGHVSAIGNGEAAPDEVADKKPIVMVLDAAKLADVTQIVANLEKAAGVEPM